MTAPRLTGDEIDDVAEETAQGGAQDVDDIERTHERQIGVDPNFWKWKRR
jgi:hypothetical protein